MFVVGCKKSDTGTSDNSVKYGLGLTVIPKLGDDEFINMKLIFHIIHNGEAVGEGANISASEINKQVELLNDNYRNKYGYSNDTRIMFSLADSSPVGSLLEEKGIERVYRPEKFFGDGLLDEDKNNWVLDLMWDPNRYINIFVFNAADTYSYSYSTLPYTTNRFNVPGLKVINEYYLYNPIKRIQGIALNNKHLSVKYVLTHEMGHYLGLLHVFNESGCDGDDYCSDTYHYDRSQYVSSKDGYYRTSCSGVRFISDNFMDYYISYQRKFSVEQELRMRYVINYCPSRYRLWYFKKKYVSTEKVALPPKPDICYCRY